MNTFIHFVSTHKKVTTTVALVWVVTLAGSYLLGVKYTANPSLSGASSAFTGSRGNFAGQSRTGQSSGASRLGGGISGTILSLSPDTLVVKSPDGNSRIVMISASTTVARIETIPFSSLTIGAEVSIMGVNGTNGAITARSIQVRPSTTPSR